ncbi:MAG: serine/threonine protein kinase [Proteobacteria bacterium]|nr:serine/threonine protein kinase [Pseudomonadota bacterium]
MTDSVQVSGYKLVQKIGEGGMATVYLAVQESLDREVALKIMSPALAANETFRDQFLKEGRIAAKLTHPHLMTVHDIGSDNGVYYLASEYLPAGTLRDRMQRLNTAEVLEIVRDVASGLSYAHEMGFVHRDVKPGNIMFRSNGSAVLADFGIAKAIKSVSAATMAGNAIGTPDYMSPEQAQATPVDGRSDLYSLGAVLFECLAGRKPYQASDAYAVALMHVTEPVPKLPEKLAWLQPLIDGLMAKRVDDRFANGDAFVAALDRLLAANPQLDAVLRESRSARRRAVAAAGTVSGAVAPTGSRKWIFAGVGIAVVLVASLAWKTWHGKTTGPIESATPIAPTETAPDSPSPPLVMAENAAADANLAKMDLPTLLSRGDEYLAYGEKNYGEKLDFPPGDNATDLFLEARKRDPENGRAAKGLEQIAAFFVNAANSALKNGLYTATDEFIKKGLRADPKNAALLKLKSQLAKAEAG